MKISTGILPFRIIRKKPEYFLVHPGGPFWKNKQQGAWSIVKGELDDPSMPLLQNAIREWKEETGFDTSGAYIPLPPAKQKSGKLVHAWAMEFDGDPDNMRSNTFELEWPPRSGKKIKVPEVDEARWLSFNEAMELILPGQAPILQALHELLLAGKKNWQDQIVNET